MSNSDVDGDPPATAGEGPRHPDFGAIHLQRNLKRQSVRGGAMAIGGQACKFILQVVSTVVLARLLTPHDFGLVAMVAVFTNFVGMFKDLGLSMATIQRAEITHAQVSTLFWINVVISIVLAGIGMSLAPVMAWLYGEPELVRIALVVSATFILGGLAAQHTALLRRQMKFQLLVFSDVATLALGIATAVILAAMGAGYWALVGMIVVEAATAACFAWSFSGWRPGLPRRHCGVRSMVAFGSNLTGFSTLNYLSRNADNLLIGWYWGPGPLGLYSKAYAMLMMPIRQINAPIAQVAIPVLSRLTNDPAEYERYYLRALTSVLWITGPLVAVMASCSQEIVLLAFGERWLGAVGPFRILAFAALLQPLYNTISWIFVTQGRTDRMFRWAMITSPLMVISFAIGLPFGITGVALSYTTVWLIGVMSWTFQYTFQGTCLTIMKMLKSVWPPLIASVIGLSFAALVIELTTTTVAWVRLATGSAAALTSIALAVAAVPGIRYSFGNLIEMRRHFQSKKVE